MCTVQKMEDEKITKVRYHFQKGLRKSVLGDSFLYDIGNEVLREKRIK